MPTMLNHIKADKWSFCGVDLTEEYIQRVQVPLCLDALGWPAESVLAMMERVDFPLGQTARIPALRNILIAREEAREQAEKEQRERERQAFYNSPEQVAKRERDQAEFIRYSQQQAARIRGARAASPRGNDVDYAPTVMFD